MGPLTLRVLIFVAGALTPPATLFAQGALADQTTLAGTWTGTDVISITSGTQTGSVSFTCTFIFLYTGADDLGTTPGQPDYRLNYTVLRTWRCTAVRLPSNVTSGVTVGSVYSDSQRCSFRPSSTPSFAVLIGTPALFPTFSISIPGYAAVGGPRSATTMRLTDSQSTNATSSTVGIRTEETIELTYADPPYITRQPLSQTVRVGDPVTLSVSASGVLNYQWLKSGAIIAGATSSRLAMSAAQIADSGSYSVRLTNDNGSTVSNGVTLTVNPITSAPIVSRQPASNLVPVGATVAFNVTASGQPTPSYQWRLNGNAIAGATGARLLLTSVSANSAGTYTCTVANSVGSITTSAATLSVTNTTTNVGRLINLSVNSTASKSQALTVGFVTGGAGTTGSQNLLIRATGPALAAFGVPNTLADPSLTLFNGQVATASNDNWGVPASNQTEVTTANRATGAFSLTNPASLDAALVVALAKSQGYTVQVVGSTTVAGSTLAEIYDHTPVGAYTPSTPRLINVSTLNQVAANGSLIAGFVVGGSTARTVLIRAIGPALAAFGVGGTIPDPQVALHTTVNNQDVVLAANAAWGGDAQLTTVGTAVGAFGLTNAASKDSVLLVTLAPGAYTAVASSVSGAAGLALVEVYEVP